MTWQVIPAGVGTSPSTGATRYASIVGAGEGVWYAAEADAVMAVPFGFVVRGLYVRPASGQLDAGDGWTLTVRKNGADTSVTVTVLGSTEYEQSELNGVAFTAFEEIAMKCVPVGTPVGALLNWGFIIQPTTPNKMCFMGSTGAANLGNNFYMCSHGVSVGANSVEYYVQSLWPVAGTITKMLCMLDSAPILGTSRTFTLRVNGVDSALVNTMGALSDLQAVSGSIAIAAGDVTSIRTSFTGVPPSTMARASIVFEPTEKGLSVFHGCSQTNLGTGQLFNYSSTGGDQWNAGGGDRVSILIPPFSIYEMHAMLNVAPGAGNTRTIKSLWDIADVGDNIVFGAADTYGSVAIRRDSTVNRHFMASTSTSGPPASRALWSFVSRHPKLQGVY